jgi:hypothetical protein
MALIRWDPFRGALTLREAINCAALKCVIY